MSENTTPTAENGPDCGHPNHGGPSHDCTPFLPCDDLACPCGRPKAEGGAVGALAQALWEIQGYTNTPVPASVEAFRRQAAAILESGVVVPATPHVVGEPNG